VDLEETEEKVREIILELERCLVELRLILREISKTILILEEVNEDGKGSDTSA